MIEKLSQDVCRSISSYGCRRLANQSMKHDGEDVTPFKRKRLELKLQM